jgi:glycosyltransferase involved in cell wall biosynthesis
MSACVGGEMKRRFVFHVGPGLTQKGGIASVLLSYQNSAATFERHGYKLKFLGTTDSSLFGYLAFGLSIVKLIVASLRNQIFVVHIHTSIRGSLFRKSVIALICVMLGEKYIVHVHSGKFFDFCAELKNLYKKILLYMFRHASHVICLSEGARSELISSGMVSESSCSIVYNGLSDRSHVRRPPATRMDVVKILFLGKLLEEKGIYVLLEAITRVDIECNPFELIVAGNGDVARFESHLSRLNLHGCVKFIGWVQGKKKEALLDRADVFVLPSRSEGFSVAIIEAMAASMSIVSTNIPGIVDALEPEVSGLLVAPDDPEALGAALERVLKDTDLRQRLACNARARYLKNFTIIRTIERLIDVYEGLKIYDRKFE